MFVGIPNPNVLMPLEKMTIYNLENGDSFEVLYNPQSYQQSRKVEYSRLPVMGTDVPMAQFNHGSGETLKVQLFFDSLSASGEIGGSAGDRLKFTANSLLPSAGNQIDIRKYTEKIYGLTLIVAKDHIHAPPKLRLEWGSLSFEGYLVSCTQNFTRFDERGMPVRAMLDCEFEQHVDPARHSSKNPLESPDTTKYRPVHQGDTLWSLAAKEYGEARQWRAIAEANGLANPRSLRTGDMLTLPGLE